MPGYTGISAERATELGFRQSYRLMENGELRAYINVEDGDQEDVVTWMPRDKPGGWQKSHHHVRIQEHYFVQNRWIAYATLETDGTAKIQVFGPGERFVTATNCVHNVYMPAAAVIHTVKQGPKSHRDWYAGYDLDKLTRGLSEEDIFRCANLSGAEIEYLRSSHQRFT